MASNRKLFLIGLGVAAVVGFGLCIGGIFLVPLLVPGGIILGASIGALVNDIKWSDLSEGHEVPEEKEESKEDEIIEESRVPHIDIQETEAELLFKYHSRRLDAYQNNEGDDYNGHEPNLKMRMKKHIQ